MNKFEYFNEVSLKQYFKLIKEIHLLSPEEEFELAKAKSMGDEKSREKLIISNLRLVVKIAKIFTCIEPSLIDLIQEGNIGLMKAAERFDYRLGCKFSTYASYWIKHYITRFIAKRSRAIRVPIRKGDLYKKIKRCQDILFNGLGREASIEEISEYIGINEKLVFEILNIFQPTVSL